MPPENPTRKHVRIVKRKFARLPAKTTAVRAAARNNLKIPPAKPGGSFKKD